MYAKLLPIFDRYNSKSNQSWILSVSIMESPNSFLISKDKFLNVQDFDLRTDFLKLWKKL